MEDFLSSQDDFRIRVNYTEIEKKLNIYDVIAGLEKVNFFNEEDYAFFEERKTQPDLNLTEYFIFNILLKRGTYGHLEEIRRLLQEKQPEVLTYFPEVKDAEENCEENEENSSGGTVLEEDTLVDNVRVATAGTPSLISKPTKQPTAHNNFKAAGVSASRQRPAVEVDHGDTIEEVVQPADEPDGKANKSFLKSIKRRLSFKKKRDSKRNFAKLENSHDVGTQAPDNGDQPLFPAGLKHLFGPNPKDKPKRISSFTDAFLHYKFKDRGRPYGRGMCVIFSLFTADLPGYVYDVQKLQSHFQGMQYEVRSGPGYTNITRKELFERISEVTMYMEEQETFDRLVVVVLTHGKEDGLLTCADTDGLIEEQEQGVFKRNEKWYKGFRPVKTQVEEIVDCFKHDMVKSMKDYPKLFLIQACRGQGIVQAANAPRDTGLDEVDASGLIASDLQFNTQTPVDGDIIVCNATTANHSSLVNPYTGSWFIQKTLEVFQKYQTREHVVDMMTVVNLAVSELRGAVYPKNADPYKAIQIPSITSSLRKKFYLYNTKLSESFTEGNVGISLPIDVRLPPQFVPPEEKQSMVNPGPSRTIYSQYPSEPKAQPPQLPQIQKHHGSTHQYPVSQERQPGQSRPTQNAPQRQSDQQRQGQLPGIYPNHTNQSSPHLPGRQPDGLNRLPVYQQQGMMPIQGTTFTTVQPLTVYKCDSAENVQPTSNAESRAPLASSES